MMNRYNIFLFSIIFVVAIVFYYLFYYEKPDDIDETESRLKFLQESKNIEKKDFVSILESLLPKKEDTKEIIQSPPVEQNTNIESIEEPQDEPPLKLLAILNDEAYISNKWYKINDTLMYKNHKYVIKRINGYKVFLVGVTNTKDNITLEMFPNNDGLYFESSENK